MKMIKTFHEAPKAYFHEVQKITDGDYALVHLFETDPEYFNLFKEALAEGREVILDNSIFELGTAFDPGKFLTWIKLLKPTYYIVPDVLEAAVGTVSNMANWINDFESEVPKECKKIGVVQGKTFKELCSCYKYMVNVAKVDKVAISFDYSYYEKTFPHPNKLISWAFGRAKFLGDLEKEGILRKDTPHHLLGCGTPGEGILYCSPEFDYIDSVDTSNPVVHGLANISYKGSLGLTSKSPTKLYTLMDKPLEKDRLDTVRYNIKEFRRLWRGNYGI